MRTKFLFVLALLSVVLPRQGHAKPLSLEGLLQEVERQNPLLQVRRKEARAAHERKAQISALDDPMLMAEIWQAPTDGSQVPLMVTLRQPIPWPGKFVKRRRVASLAAERTALGEAETLRTLRLQTAKAYYDYLRASLGIAVLGESESLLQTVIAAVEVRYKVGRAELSELLRAREEAALLSVQLLDLKTERDVAASEINLLRGRGVDEPLGEAASEPELVPLPAPPWDGLLRRAEERRLELASLRLEGQEALAMANLARQKRGPDLALWGSYMMPLAGPRQREDQGLMPSTFTVGVSMALPSFTLLASRAEEREALAAFEAKEASAVYARLQIRAEVHKAALALRTAERHVHFHRETVIPLSQRAFDSARVGYQNGRGDLSLLLTILRGLFQHRLEYTRYLSDYGIKVAELEAAIGASLREVTR